MIRSKRTRTAERDSLAEIVDICLSIDRHAFEMYTRFSRDTETVELRVFWSHMAAEEREHVRMWERLIALTEDHALPRVFDSPEETLEDLRIVRGKVRDLTRRYVAAPGDANAFLLAYRLEIFMLHPAFEVLFNLIHTVLGKPRATDSYEDHIAEFVDMLVRFDGLTPELEMLGETLQSLWRHNRTLTRENRIDELTGVFNRRGFFDAIAPLCHLAQRNALNVGVVMADLDDFKRINDTHGHSAGDRILRRVAGVIRSNVRLSDVVGRYGGEEFIVFLPSIEGHSIRRVAEKIRRRIIQETKDGIPVTVSIGVSEGVLTDEARDGIVALINEADGRLYEVKRRGKNRVCSP